MAGRDALRGKKVAILATDGFEQSELLTPRRELETAGAEVCIVSPKDGAIQGYEHHDKGDKVEVDAVLSEVAADDFDGLVLPGGVINPDALRMEKPAVDFVRSFFDSGKPLAAICHGAWLLVEADIVKGRRVTSWPSLRRDIENAGGEWVDEEVVTDQGLVTSRKPDDLKAFCRKIIEELREGRHERRAS